MSYNILYMSDKLSKRQQSIILLMTFGISYSLGDILKDLSKTEKVSTATLRRDLVELVEKNFISQSGKLRGTRYQLTQEGILNAPLNPTEYLAIDIDKRSGNKTFTFGLFEKLSSSLVSSESKTQLDKVTDSYREKSKNASNTILQKELERFVIELSWKSSEIEGNTYTLLDTELLLKEGITASGHSKEEATMIINHKKAFQYVLDNPDKHKSMKVTIIEDIHSILVKDLGVSSGIRSRFVGITGSLYAPLSVPTQIKEALDSLCLAVDRMKDPYSKALLILLGISYIQPFEDGNKRTARLVANAILMAHQCAPLSYRGVEVKLYLEGLLIFYEKNSINPMRDIFIKQYLFSCEQYLQFQH